MVAALVQLADLLVQIARFGGVYGIVDEAAALCPNALEKAPKAADQSDLESGCIEVLLRGYLHGIKWLHGPTPTWRDPAFEHVDPANATLLINRGLKHAASGVIGDRVVGMGCDAHDVREFVMDHGPDDWEDLRRFEELAE